MDKQLIDNTIQNNQMTLDLLEDCKYTEAYQKLIDSFPELQKTMLALIEEKIVEEEIMVLILNDVISAMDNKDGVLLADSLRYGINELLFEVLGAGEEIANA